MVSAGRHARRWGACVASAIIALAILLFPPTPSFGRIQGSKQPPAASQITNADRNTDAVPSPTPTQVINVYQSPREIDQEKHDTKDDSGKSSADWWMVRLTVFLVIFAFVQCLIFAAQAITSYMQLRAYLFIEDAKITPPESADGIEWEVEYTIKNNGPTPAHRIKTWDIVSVENWYPDKIPRPIDSDYLGSIGPNGDFVDATAILENGITGFDLAYSKPSESKEKAIFLVGRIRYRDVFGVPHKTDFCFFAKGAIKKGDQMEAYDEGNDST